MVELPEDSFECKRKMEGKRLPTHWCLLTFFQGIQKNMNNLWLYLRKFRNKRNQMIKCILRIKLNEGKNIHNCYVKIVHRWV